jgi:hypothetical protein
MTSARTAVLSALMHDQGHALDYLPTAILEERANLIADRGLVTPDVDARCFEHPGEGCDWDSLDALEEALHLREHPEDAHDN